MRCVACNKMMEVAYWVPRGCVEPILQDMCSGCRAVIKYHSAGDAEEFTEILRGGSGKGDIIEEILYPVRGNIEECWNEPDEEG